MSSSRSTGDSPATAATRPPRPWLFAFALRAARRTWKLARHRADLVEDAGDIADTAPSPADQAVALQRMDLVVRARFLDFDRRTIFVLHEIDGVATRRGGDPARNPIEDRVLAAAPPRARGFCPGGAPPRVLWRLPMTRREDSEARSAHRDRSPARSDGRRADSRPPSSDARPRSTSPPATHEATPAAPRAIASDCEAQRFLRTLSFTA